MNRRIFLACFLIKIKLSMHLHHKITYLYQKDFENGSYIIDKPGTYVLKENIIFDPPFNPPLKLQE